MSGASLLDELASQAGIEPDYHDVWGARHALSDAAKRAFLGAMGMPAATEEEVAGSLASLGAKPWRRALEPVTVFPEGNHGATLSVVLEAETTRAATWCITAEDGGRSRGNISLGDLPIVATATVEGRRLERRLLALPGSLPLGYHRIEVTGQGLPGGAGAAMLVVAPQHAYLPGKLRRGPGLWGFGLQLYGLQGRASWGLGDFGDLSRFASASARLGAGALGLNPLHALFPGNPTHASPYAPSSRCFLNPLYINVEAVPEFAACAEARAQVADPPFAALLAALRNAPLIDYAAVAAAKFSLLERLHSAFRVYHLQRGTARAQAFRKFQREGGAALERFSTFAVLAEHFRGDGSNHRPWRDWSAAYRDPESPETAAFARDHADRVTFHQYLQWEADRQLASAARTCTENGMSVGLYRDLALGVDPGGMDAWAEQRVLALEISTGAPPDPFSLKGQSWGLPPFNPHALRDAAYRPFIACLRANMRHAGALRIDHIMGLTRLFWIPGEASAVEGGYVRYPLDDLLAITALESQRARCAVVGEDLGTVPEGLRERLRAMWILSTRLLYFERDGDGAFRPAHSYPELAHVAVATHDLPTFPGYWRDRDIAVRAALHQLPDAASEAALRRDRVLARDALLALLRSGGFLPANERPAEGADIPIDALVDAAYRFLATTPARLLMVQLEDVFGIEEQANLPGTVDEHPNWRRKLPLPWEELATSQRLRRFATILAELRPF